MVISGFYQILPAPKFETKKYSLDRNKIDVGGCWIDYEYDDEDEKVETSSSSTERLDRNGVKVKDSKLLTLLKKYRHLLILKQNLTMEEEKTVIKSLFPDADHSVGLLVLLIQRVGRKKSFGMLKNLKRL